MFYEISDHPGEQKHDHYASNSKNLYQVIKNEILSIYFYLYK